MNCSAWCHALLAIGEAEIAGTNPGNATLLILDRDALVEGDQTEWTSRFNPQLILLLGFQEDASSAVLAKSAHGWLQVTTGGKQVWVEEEKK